MKICEHTLNYTEVKHKILTLSRHYRAYFPPPRTEINIFYAGRTGKGKMHSSGQILKYISLVKNQIKDANVRAIIVAHNFKEGLELAVSSLNNVKLKKYKVNFEFEDITLNNSGD